MSGTDPTASGVYSFVVPVNPPGPGVYPVKIHMSPVGSTNRLATDLQLTENAWTHTDESRVSTATERVIYYDLQVPSAEPEGETEVVAVYEGRDWVFVAKQIPSKPLIPTEWTILFTGFGMEEQIWFEVGSLENPLQVDTLQGTIRALVLPNHTQHFVPGSSGTVDLVYQMFSNEHTIFRRVLEIAVN